MSRRIFIAAVLAGTATLGLLSTQATPSAAPQTANAAAAVAAAPLPERVLFNRDIRPILSDKCLKCHGPGTQMASLRFDREEDAKKALRDGKTAIVPGDVVHSEMMQRVTVTDPTPHAVQEEPLSAREVATAPALGRAGREVGTALGIRAAGAASCFRSRRMPAGCAIRSMRSYSSGSNVKDCTPSPEADRATWLRRVSLDLTGIPPTLAGARCVPCGQSPDGLRESGRPPARRRRVTASAWRSPGSKRRATPTAMAIRATANATCGAGATG